MSGVKAGERKMSDDRVYLLLRRHPSKEGRKQAEGEREHIDFEARTSVSMTKSPPRGSRHKSRRLSRSSVEHATEDPFSNVYKRSLERISSSLRLFLHTDARKCINRDGMPAKFTNGERNLTIFVFRPRKTGIEFSCQK